MKMGLESLRRTLWPSRWYPRTIAGRIQLLVLVCVLPSWLMAVAVTWYFHRQAELSRLVDSGYVAQALGHAIDGELDKQIVTLQTLATTTRVDEQDYTRLLERSLQVKELSGAFVIFMVRPDMQMLMNLYPLTGPRLPKLPVDQLPEVIVQRRPGVTDLFVGQLVNRAFVGVAVPVIRQGEVIARMDMVLTPDRFAKVLAHQSLPQGWQAAVFDRKGIVIASLDTDQHRMGDRVAQVLFDASRSGAQGHVQRRDAHGELLITCFARSERYGWTVAVAVPERLLNAELRRSLALQAAGAAVLLILGLGLGRQIGRRISQPIQDLVQPALAIGRGDSTTVLPEDSLRETYTVATALLQAQQLLAARERARAAAEEAARDSQSRLNLTLDATQVGDWALDLHSGVFHHSARHDQCFGFMQAVPERKLPDFLARIHPDDRDAVVRDVSAARAAIADWQHEFRILWPDGSVHWLAVRGTHQIENGVAARQLGIVMDVTGRKQDEALHLENLRLTLENGQVQEASRLKSHFLANMSHELRTPLNAVIGFSELLLIDGQVQDVAHQTEYLGHIRASGKHLLCLIDDLLDLSRAEAGRIAFHPRPFLIRELVNEARAALQQQVLAKKQQLHCEVAVGLEEVCLDPTRLRQVLFNLLSNAVKFTGPGGRINVRVLPEGESQLRIEVKDSGIGVAAADQVRLFQPFHRVGEGLASSQPGTGLGLALVRQLVVLQGGHVGLNSTLGVGSVFYVVLPLRQTAQGA